MPVKFLENAIFRIWKSSARLSTIPCVFLKFRNVLVVALICEKRNKLINKLLSCIRAHLKVKSLSFQDSVKFAGFVVVVT